MLEIKNPLFRCQLKKIQNVSITASQSCNFYDSKWVVMSKCYLGV